MSAPLTQLKAAERDLVSAIHATAVVVESIATNDVDDALLRLEHAIRGAHARLAGAMGTMRNTVEELTDCMRAMTADTLADLRSATVEITGPGLLEFPAPAATPTPSPTPPEPTETTTEPTDTDTARREALERFDEKPEPVLVGGPAPGRNGRTRTRPRKG